MFLFSWTDLWWSPSQCMEGQWALSEATRVEEPHRLKWLSLASLGDDLAPNRMFVLDFEISFLPLY